MRVDVEARSSGPGPRQSAGWRTARREVSHQSRIVQECIRAVLSCWPRDGVAIIIRRAE